MIRLLAALALVSCTAPLGAAGVVALCGDDAGVDAANALADAALDAFEPDLDAPPDAPAGISLTTPWPMQTLVAWNDCRGADGADVATIGGKRHIAVACEQGAKAGYAREDSPGSWSWHPFPEQLQHPEDAIWCDREGDGDLDLFVAEQTGHRINVWPSDGADNFGARETVVGSAQLYIRLYCAAPGVIYSGSYGTGASIDQHALIPLTGAWVRTVLGVGGTVQNFEPFGADVLVWDATGPLRGVHLLFAGTRLTQDVYTQWGHVVDGRITTGTANPTTLVSTISILGEPAITFPVNAGWYHDSAIADIDADGLKDIALVMSHAPGDLSSALWLRAPNWERGEISGPTGTKHDNAKLVDWRAPGVFDLLTTEEDTLGLVLYLNPRLAP